MQGNPAMPGGAVPSEPAWGTPEKCPPRRLFFLQEEAAQGQAATGTVVLVYSLASSVPGLNIRIRNW